MVWEIADENYFKKVPADLCVGIEGGYLLAYRGGWNVTELIALTSFASTVAIILVGLFFFKEAVPLSAIVGLAFVLGGVGLIHWR